MERSSTRVLIMQGFASEMVPGVHNYNLPFNIYHQGLFHSVRRNPSLNCFHRRRSLPILAHAGPRWRIRLSLHLILGLPCRLVHSRGVHSVTLLVHLLSLKRAMCPAHPYIPFLITSMMSFTPVSCRIQVLRLWSRRVMPSMMRSICRCATDSTVKPLIVNTPD